MWRVDKGEIMSGAAYKLIISNSLKGVIVPANALTLKLT